MKKATTERGAGKMKINWKLRLKNRTTLTAIVLGVLSLIYQILGMLGLVPGVSESEIAQTAAVAIDILVLLGIVTDPTTAGVSDSAQAMEYKEPKA